MSYLEIAKKFLEERKAKEGFIKGGDSGDPRK